MEPELQCAKCGITVLRATYNQKYCKTCGAAAERESVKQWRHEHPDYMPNWRRAHREILREQERKWRDKHPEYYEYIREYQRVWMHKYRKEYPERVSLCNRKHYQKNQEYEQERVRKWQQEHPEAASIWRNNRRARVKGNGGSHTAEELRALIALQEYRCFYCNTPFFDNTLNSKYHIDHKIPLSRGGSNDISNIVFACAKCNLSKSTKTAEEFISKI